MPTYKAIVTLTWQITTNEPASDCLQVAQSQLESALCDVNQLPDFSCHLELTRKKEKKTLVHLGQVPFSDVFDHLSGEEAKRPYTVGDKTYYVRMNSDRYHVFKDSQTCIACGLTGTHLLLDLNPTDSSPHFNLYGEEEGRLVLMTKDHLVPKSRGGSDDLSNLKTCCAICNNLKADFDITYEQVRELRELVNNGKEMSKKQLRILINSTRLKMASQKEAVLAI